MVRKSLVVFVACISLALSVALYAAVDTPTGAKLSATAIVDRNVEARGGLQQWRAVQTMTLEGKMGAGGNRRSTLSVPPPPGPLPDAKEIPQRPVDEAQLPFVMELKRPRKTRVELAFNGQTAIQVFDGTNVGS